MKRWQVELMATLVGVCVVAYIVGCASTAATVAAVAKSAAPFLPPPWNIVASGVGIVAAFTASHYANRSKAATLADGGQPSPVVKAFAERKWFYPLMAAGVAAGNAAGWWTIDPATLATIVGGLGIPALAEGLKDARGPAQPGPPEA